MPNNYIEKVFWEATQELKTWFDTHKVDEKPPTEMVKRYVELQTQMLDWLEEEES